MGDTKKVISYDTDTQYENQL